MTATSLVESIAATAVSALGGALNLGHTSCRPDFDGAYLGHVPYFAPRMTAREKSSFICSVASPVR